MSNGANVSLNLNLAQIAWVVKDVEATKKFFEDTLGINNFSKVATVRVKDYNATYYGEPSDDESLVAMAYSGGTFLELIQPLSGKSIYQDYIDNNPEGGVHHIAYSLPIAGFDKIIFRFESKGFPVVSSYDTPIAKIVMFDTRKEMGVFTEIMGITEVGENVVEKMKSGKW